MMLVRSVLGRLNKPVVRAAAQVNASRGLYSYPLSLPLQLGEYHIRPIEDREMEEIFDFQFKHLHRDEALHSELYIEEKGKFYYRLCQSGNKFKLLVAMKNTERYMQDLMEKNERDHHVSMQRRSWFTPERMKKLGIVAKPFVPPEIKVLGTANLFMGRNVPEELGVSPVDRSWFSSKEKDGAYVEPLVADMVRRNHVGTELFRFAKSQVMQMGVQKMFMQVDTAAGLKFGARVGLKMIPTVPTVPKSKILLGQKLTFK